MALSRRLVAEALGTAALVATVAGSGIMAERLTSDVALALLANAIATAGILVVLIATLGPISGAQFNPVVTLVLALRRELGWGEAIGYVAAQVLGGLVGIALAHGMFDMPLLQVSQHVRSGAGQWLSEVVATFGLVTVILLNQSRAQLIPGLVGLYIGAAYWFTASTSFANPAVTLARAFTSTFSGIAPGDVLPFILAQLVGALAALAVARWLVTPSNSQTRASSP
jgi:glycerol uptake facilitator-like aquaporin